MYMIATEEGVKKIARDYDVYSQRKLVKNEDSKKTQTSGNVNRGTKNLMMQIQDELKKDEDPALIDPEQLEPEIDDFPSIEEDYDE